MSYVAYAGLKSHHQFSGERWDDGGVHVVKDRVAEETPVALRFNGTPFVVMMATPQDLTDFVLGFCLSEGIIEVANEIRDVALQKHPEGIEINVELASERFARLDKQGRNLTGRTGCGLCGTRELAQAMRHPPAVETGLTVTHGAISRALDSLSEHQPLNAVTGSLHAAAWVNELGEIQLAREDVGRHNALDKMIGALLAAGESFQTGWILLTSRASYEMIQKAATAGIQVVAAVSAPTGLAIRLARETGITLVAYARTDRHTLYTHPQRITEESKAIAA